MARYIIAKTLTFLTIPCLVFSYAHADNCFYDPIVAGTEHKLLSPNLNISCPAVMLSLENGTDVPLIVTNSSRCLVRPELSLFVPDTASGQIVLTWGCEAQEGTLEPDDQTMDEQDAEPCIAYEVSPRAPSQTLEYPGSVFSISQSCAVPSQTGASGTRTGSSNAVQGTHTESSNVSLAPTSSTTAYTETDATRTGTARPITSSAPPSSITPLSTNPASYLSSIDGVIRTYTTASQPVPGFGSVVPSSLPQSSGAGYGVSQYATTPGTPFYTNIASIGLGRPFLYSLGYGQEGVENAVAPLAVLKDGIETAMRLCGITDLMRDASPDFVNTNDLDHLVPALAHPYARKVKRELSNL
ncbi:hypothetical protein G7054_g12418 [Neopestalotiopsis clavispora]|nr:hypothetical protein G7054_g12418 [Neopestalotiopsis clavispora]